MKKILIGTTNVGKQKEFKKRVGEIFKSPDKIEILLPQDVGITETPVEIGKTFEENSLLKAKFYFDKTGIPTIADDGGLEVPILNNEPGVYSRRWIDGTDATDEELIVYTLQRLTQYSNQKDRQAQLRTCITFYSGNTYVQESGTVEGYISDQRYTNYSKGYPFRALFVVKDIDKYYDELTSVEHESHNHRVKALTALWEKIKNIV